MIRRVPIVATVLVLLAVAAMVWLGVWQLQRMQWKEGLLALYAKNEKLPPIAFPAIAVGDSYLFRGATAMCLKPVSWSTEGGRSANGDVGWRQIAHCVTSAEGPGLTVQLGVTKDTNWKPAWGGGPVSGYIDYAPSHTPLIASIFGKEPPRELMLVADQPLPGLMPNPKPDLASVPNNHFAYAIQWFLFAGIALLIYGLALRKRLRDQRPRA
jgi:cytochrome oxidase assembly protein ShyY1